MNDDHRQPAQGAPLRGEGGARPGPPPRPGGWFDPPTPTAEPPEPPATVAGPDPYEATEVTEELPAVADGPPAPAEPAAEPVTRVERIETEVPPAGGALATRVRPVEAGDGDGAPAPPDSQRTRSLPPDQGRADPPGGLEVFWGSASAPLSPPAGQPGNGQPEPLAPGRRGFVLVGLLTVILLVVGAGLAGVLLLRGDGRLGSLAGAVTGGRGQGAAAPAAPATVVVTPANGQKKVRPDSPVRVIASGGRLTSVKVTASRGGTVAGKLSADGASWQSSGRMIPQTRYTITARAVNPEGKASTTKSSFTTLTPAGRLGTSIMPLDGETVGVGMPIGIFFTAPVADQAAVERQLQVSTSSRVKGAWRWFGDRQVRWRPRDFWPAGEKVTLRVKLAGVHAGGGVWGMANRTVSFTVGDSHISTVNVKTHKMTVAVNGKVAKTLPVSTGRQKFPTTNGVHTVLEKNRHKIMDSATVGIPKGDPGYYRTAVEFAVRITNTGEFVHAAPWSEGSQGNQNVSHGCVNLSLENGSWFFGLSRRGDVVKVLGSPRQPGETEGLLEWNRSFEDWKAGSAL